MSRFDMDEMVSLAREANEMSSDAQPGAWQDLALRFARLVGLPGPWAIVSPGDDTYYVTDNVVMARFGPYTEAVARAVRDALNAVARVGSPAPTLQDQIEAVEAEGYVVVELTCERCCHGSGRHGGVCRLSPAPTDAPDFAAIRKAVREKFDRDALQLAELCCESRPAALSIEDVRHWIGNAVALAVSLRAASPALREGAPDPIAKKVAEWRALAVRVRTNANMNNYTPDYRARLDVKASQLEACALDLEAAVGVGAPDVEKLRAALAQIEELAALNDREYRPIMSAHDMFLRNERILALARAALSTGAGEPTP